MFTVSAPYLHACDSTKIISQVRPNLIERRETKTIAAAAPELAGKTIAVAETRELDVLAQLFEQRGATVIRCPLIAIFDAPDPTPIEAWLRRFVAGACDDLVLFTGEGLRRLLCFAERIELRDAFIGALGRVRKIARGPKPVRALREIGLAADIQAVEPTTEGIIAALSAFNLTGRMVGIQLYGDEPNVPLMNFLARAGAEADPVAPYVYPKSGGWALAKLRHVFDIVRHGDARHSFARSPCG